MKLLLRALCNPLLVLLLAVGGFYGYYKWEVIKAKWDLQEAIKNNEALKEAIANLTATETVAFVDVSKRVESKSGAKVSFIFSETERNQPNREIDEGIKLNADGNLTYFEALVVSFNFDQVKEGKKAIFLWRRVFGEDEAPSKGHSLKQSLPKAYEEISKACNKTFFGFQLTDNAKEFWNSIWDLANNPDKLKSLGIQSIQAKASGIKLMSGMRYKLTIGSTGKMDINATGPSPIIRTFNSSMP